MGPFSDFSDAGRSRPQDRLHHHTWLGAVGSALLRGGSSTPTRVRCGRCRVRRPLHERDNQPFQIVGQGVEAHLRSDLVEGPGEGVDAKALMSEALAA